MIRLAKIVSGGQTGADRAALDVAIQFGIPHGGWIPKGRKTERGPLPAEYQLKEMPTADYPKRTEQNVMDSDGTMIVCHGPLTGGSEYTRKLADKQDKPWIHVDTSRISVEAGVEFVRAWINGSDVRVLNVAGPRASKDPKIYGATKRLLTLLIKTMLVGSEESKDLQG
jgi:hypothetical protein